MNTLVKLAQNVEWNVEQFGNKPKVTNIRGTWIKFDYFNKFCDKAILATLDMKGKTIQQIFDDYCAEYGKTFGRFSSFELI